MKYTRYIVLIAALTCNLAQARQEGSPHQQSDMVAYIATLSDDEKVALIDHLISDHEASLSRGAPLPMTLVDQPTRSDNNDEQEKPQMEPAKRKFTTLTIAPNATSACFLPKVFSFNNQGKYFMYQSGAIGALVGVLAAMGIDLAMKRNSTKILNRINAVQDSTTTFATVSGGLFAGLAVAIGNYYRMKKSYVKGEDEDVINFIQYRWKDLRGELIWPQHVVSILDYLKRKADRGTFDLEEAKQCISALHEPGRVT